MRRLATQDLIDWLGAAGRRPLVLRGARQVGKTWLVRDLAPRAGRDLVELNFERDPRLRQAFRSNDPIEVLSELELLTGRPVDPATAILFLDEVQEAGEVLAKLRWFYERLPELPVIAAGSLLEFTLADHALSMPVGRVTFRKVEPMGFPEYLLAKGQRKLLEVLSSWRPGRELTPAAHTRATELWSRHAMVGGMPAVVETDVARGTAQACRQLQQDLVATYRADFAKYGTRAQREVLDAVLLAAVRMLGQKFVYARAGDGLKSHHVKAAVELLAQAHVCRLVPHSAANGVPLGAEASTRHRKVFLLDAGLAHALAGTPAATGFPRLDQLAPSLRGGLMEQLVAQQLCLAVGPSPVGGELFYWQRHGGRPGEIDFIVQCSGRVVPVEVKAGAAGSMKSLHQFMHDKGLDLALRCDANPPDLQALSLSTTKAQPVAYRLLSLPHYLVWNLAEIVTSL